MGNTPQQGSSNTNTQSNCTEGYHSQMNSIAVRSVVEMGYSNEQIMSALQKINLSRQGIKMHSNYTRKTLMIPKG